jgi:hypothetical protein
MWSITTGTGGAQDRGRQLRDHVNGHVDLKMPAERREPLAKRDYRVDGLGAAEVFHVVKARAAKAGGIEAL